MNFKDAFYGQNDTYINVTDHLIRLCNSNDGKFIIPADDGLRAKLFSDPLPGVVKVLKFSPNEIVIDVSQKIIVSTNNSQTLSVHYVDSSEILALFREFKCYYGTNDIYTDVTNDLVALCSHSTFNVPSSDVDRANLFGDPVYGFRKHLKLIDVANVEKVLIINADEKLTVFRGTANTITIPKSEVAKLIFETILKNVCFINLAHRVDRKSQFEAQMRCIGLCPDNLTRIDAVYVPTQGALGCTKSHIKTLELAIEMNWPVCAIFEDDFEWRQTCNVSNLSKTLESAWNDRAKWDVLLLAGNHQRTEAVQSLPFLKKTFYSTTTSGYIVQRHYYEKLLQNFRESAKHLEQEGKIFSPFCLDVYWSQLMQTDNWFACNPFVGKQCDGFSDISCTVRTQVDY